MDFIVVPPEIRKKLNIKPDEIIDWELDIDTRTIILSFRQEESIMDLAGIVKMDEDTNVVEVKRRVQIGR